MIGIQGCSLEAGKLPFAGIPAVCALMHYVELRCLASPQKGIPHGILESLDSPYAGLKGRIYPLQIQRSSPKEDHPPSKGIDLGLIGSGRTLKHGIQ